MHTNHHYNHYNDHPSVSPATFSVEQPAYRRGASPPKSGAFFLVLVGFFVGALGFASLKYLGPSVEAQLTSARRHAEATPEPPATVAAAASASSIDSASAGAPASAPPPAFTAAPSEIDAPDASTPAAEKIEPTPRKRARKSHPAAPAAVPIPVETAAARQ